GPHPLQVAHFLVGLCGVIIAIITLITRQDSRAFFSALLTSQAAASHIPSYDPTLARILHAVQAGVILGFVIIHHIWLRDLKADLTEQVPVAQKTLDQFANGWMYMWYGWLALYIWFFLAAAPRWNGSPGMDAVSDVLDVVSGFAIWWCFLV